MSIWHTTRNNRCGVFSPQPSNQVTINGQSVITKGFSITVGNNLVLDTKKLESTTQGEAYRCWGPEWAERLEEFLKVHGRTLGLYPGLPGRPDVTELNVEDFKEIEANKTAGVEVTDGRSLSGKKGKRVQ